MARLGLIVGLAAWLVAGCGAGGGKNEVPADVLDMADRAWCRGDSLRAASLLEDAVKKAPRAFDAVYRLGVIRAESDPAQALAHLQAAAAIDPGHPGPPLFIGLLELARNDFAGSDASMQTAYELTRRRRGLALDDTTETVRHALEAMEMERFPEAVQGFDAALQTDPGNGTLLTLKAEAQLGAGFISDALNTVRTAVEKDPHVAPARVLHGQLLFARRKIDAARIEAQAARAEIPDFCRALELEGRIYLFEGEYQEGAIHMWRALLGDPTRPIVHELLANSLLRTSQPQQASGFFRSLEAVTAFHNRRLGRAPANH